MLPKEMIYSKAPISPLFMAKHARRGGSTHPAPSNRNLPFVPIITLENSQDEASCPLDHDTPNVATPEPFKWPKPTQIANRQIPAQNAGLLDACSKHRPISRLLNMQSPKMFAPTVDVQDLTLHTDASTLSAHP